MNEIKINEERHNGDKDAILLLGDIEYKLDEVILLQRKNYINCCNTQEWRNIDFKLRIISHLESLQSFEELIKKPPLFDKMQMNLPAENFTMDNTPKPKVEE